MTVSETLAGVRRDRGVAQQAKRPFGHELRLMLAAIPPVTRAADGRLTGRSLLGIRDRSVLTLTFASFARRSKVAGSRGLR